MYSFRKWKIARGKRTRWMGEARYCDMTRALLTLVAAQHLEEDAT